MDFVIYRPDNGEILRNFTGRMEDVELQIGPGEAVLEGNGTWLTHRVESGVLVALEATRRPPSEGWHWDPATAGWFDPLLRPETSGAARVAARTRIARDMAGLEAAQLRPLREIALAAERGDAAPAAALATLRRVEEGIAALRQELTRLS